MKKDNLKPRGNLSRSEYERILFEILLVWLSTNPGEYDFYGYEEYDENDEFIIPSPKSYEECAEWIENVLSNYSEGYSITSPDGDTFEILESVGGDEGGGEYCKRVFKWKERFYRWTFNYYSYRGNDFEDAEMIEVFPEQVMTTVYN